MSLELHEEIYIKSEPFEEYDNDFDTSETFEQNLSCKNEIIEDNESTLSAVEFFYSDESTWSATENIEDTFQSIQVKTESLSSEPVTNNSFICRKCNLKFVSSEKLEHHVCLHKVVYFNCTKCNQSFMSQGRLNIHMRNHLLPPRNPNVVIKEDPRVCKICGQTFKTRHGHYRHMRNLHPGLKPLEIFNCNICNKSFKTRSNFTNHMTVHSDEKKHKCSVCSRAFKLKKYLARHIKSHEPVVEEKHKCKKCRGVFKSLEILNEHVNEVHKKVKQFKCMNAKCTEKFNSPESLREHVKTMHLQIEYLKCSKCDATFMSQSSLDTHLLTPHFKPVYFCKICLITFMSQENLNSHMQSNHPVKPLIEYAYFCEICCDKFNSRERLHQHLIKIHDATIFECSKCDASFTSKLSLSSHLGIHAEKKPFNCVICNHNFAQRHSLKKHLKNTHKLDDKSADNLLPAIKIKTKNGRKASICNICHVIFSSSITLDYHIQSFHRGFKPFECSECGSCYTQKHALRSHINVVHCGIKPFKCSICNQDFGYASHLRYHLSKTHEIDDQSVIQNMLRDCKIRDTEFKSRGNLKKKQGIVCTNIGSFKCAVCDREFTSCKGLYGHLRVHQSIKPSEDVRKTNLINFNKISLPNSNYQCDVCRKVCISLDELKEHKIIHDPFSCFKCDKCGLVANFENLEKHIAANHTEDSSFKCSDCKATFKSVQNLKRHLSNMHEKPSDVPQNASEPMVSCDSINVKCKQDFNNVMCHFNKMHTNNKQLKCDLCGKTYRQKSTLRRHFVNFHKTANLTSGLQRSPPKHQLRQSVVTNKVRQPDCKLTASSLPEMWINKVKPCYVRLDRGEVTRYLRSSEGLPPPLATPPVNPCVTSDLLLGSTLENIKQEQDYFISEIDIEENYILDDFVVNDDSSKLCSSYKNLSESVNSESEQLENFEEMYIKTEHIDLEVNDIVDPLTMGNIE